MKKMMEQRKKKLLLQHPLSLIYILRKTNLDQKKKENCVCTPNVYTTENNNERTKQIKKQLNQQRSHETRQMRSRSGIGLVLVVV